jgi:hypothetical protein
MHQLVLFVLARDWLTSAPGDVSGIRIRRVQERHTFASLVFGEVMAVRHCPPTSLEMTKGRNIPPLQGPILLAWSGVSHITHKARVLTLLKNQR